MKKLLHILLSLVMTLCLIAALVSCNTSDAPDNDTITENQTESVTESETQTESEPETQIQTETETESETETEAPIDISNNKIYTNDYITFEYPEEWIYDGASPTSLTHSTKPGSSVTIVMEQYSTLYEEMTVEDYEEIFVPVYEALEFIITDVKVEHLTNDNKIDVTKVSHVTEVAGISMTQTLIIFESNGYNHIITVTEVDPDPELVGLIISTANTVTLPETGPSTVVIPDIPAPEGYTVYTDGNISFAYPELWEKVDSSPLMFLSNANNGNNITFVSDAYSNFYETLTVESFNEFFIPTYESLGISVSDPSVEQLTNPNGLHVTKVTFTAETEGVSMKQTVLSVSEGEYTYAITVTELVPIPEVTEELFNTLNTVK